MGKISNIGSKSRSNSYSLDRRVYAIQGGGRTSLNVNGKGWDIDVSFTLNATDIHGIAYIFDARGNGEGGYHQLSQAGISHQFLTTRL